MARSFTRRTAVRERALARIQPWNTLSHVCACVRVCVCVCVRVCVCVCVCAYVCVYNRRLVLQVLGADVIPAIVSAMAGHERSVGVQSEACSALGRLAEFGGPEAKAAILGAGGRSRIQQAASQSRDSGYAHVALVALATN